jgi:hypothetical protein
VAEWSDDASVEFRTYCSQWPLDHERHVRPAILDPQDVALPPVVARLLAALGAGDADVAARCFEPRGALREAVPGLDVPRGPDELRAYFSMVLGAGGIDLLPCAVTDDGTRCAVELSCVRWGGHDVVPQAGLAVHERGPDGLLVEVRRYDDFGAPREAGTRGLPADADQGASTGR